MRIYTGFEVICIDIANQFGLDKKLFEDRIYWVTSIIDRLEVLGDKPHWKEKPLYIKAVAALRTIQKGEPTGHMCGLDAVCSG